MSDRAVAARDVTVIGAGVIGLTCAHALRGAGHRVTVIAADRPRVSDVAGGLWLPYAAGDSDEVMGWALETLAWLEARGFPAREYLHLQASEPWWLGGLPDDRVRPARAAELPAGYDHGWVLRVPLVEMPAHLKALEPSRLVRRAVTSLSEVSGLAVNCSGLAARELAEDPTVSAARGQVVHLATTPGVPCVCDEDQMIYVLPRRDRTIVGGSYQPGNENHAVEPAETELLLARARALVPQLAGAEVLDARAGLRPVRAGGPRVERVGDVIHCYGHGGAGLTSHGAARDASSSWPPAETRSGELWSTEMASCTHLDTITVLQLPESVAGCQDCLRTGGVWLHLRICLQCGRVGCCDDSPNRHATAHHHSSGHPLIRSLEPGEEWAWCFEDEVGMLIAAVRGHTRIPRSPMLSG